MSRRPHDQDRIRVRVNLHTLSLGAIVMAMAYAGAVQSNGAAYLLGFLTAALGAMSYIYARANLRGLEIQAGALTAIQAGSQGSLPLTVRAVSGLTPCGLELLVVGATRAALVERIKSGEAERVSVTLPAESEGVQKRLQLLVRSSYPLGLFSAERRIEITCLRRVHPRAAGDLPLPAPDPALRQEALALAGTAALVSREGDDFAGLREWQPGDSPRHIDWRALARGRPLMVKTWAGSAPDALRLDWQSLQLPNHQRSEQMAKWVADCERKSVPYALRLPGREVSVGLGPAHAQRCLNALADHSAQNASQVEKDNAKAARVPASYERSANLPSRPLNLLSAGVLLAVLPLWEVISPPSLLVLAFCLLWRLFRTGTPVRSWIPATIAAAGIAAVFVQQGFMVSTEAGIGVLVILQGCKLIEARSPHDFQVLAMIGWFLCLCGLLAEQSLGRSLYTVGVFAYITVCMIRFRRSTPGMKAPSRLGGLLLMQAFPIAVVLFLIFPRGSFDDLARRLGTGRTSVTGVPTELDPGAIAKLAMSDASAFRVKFPDGKLPPNQQRYWRCVVLWNCVNGLNWTRGEYLIHAPKEEYKPGPQDIRQEIDMEPHGQYWMPALDRPERGQGERAALLLEYDDTLISREVVRRPQRVAVISRTSVEAGELPASHRRAALQLPPMIPPRLSALAKQWRAEAKTDAEVIQAGLVYLRSQGFSYTLDPGEFSGPEGIDDFWFNRRAGFCGHFSASFATMMRLAGIPTRVVMGYLGGTWNQRGEYLLVRQSDAHAWIEVWQENIGWTRIDPTAVLVPSRLNLDLQGSLLGDEDELNRQRNTLWWRTYESARMFWDNVGYQWNTYVISFDEESQVEWLNYFGFSGLTQDERGALLLGVSGVFVMVSLGVLALWLRRPARHRDPWARAWHRLCRRLARMGLPERQLSEGPMAYAKRVGPESPVIADEVRRLAGIYATARYGEQKGSLKDFYRSVRRLKLDQSPKRWSD